MNEMELSALKSNKKERMTYRVTCDPQWQPDVRQDIIIGILSSGKILGKDCFGRSKSIRRIQSPECFIPPFGNGIPQKHDIDVLGKASHRQFGMCLVNSTPLRMRIGRRTCIQWIGARTKTPVFSFLNIQQKRIIF